jgi:hypothetical protein
MNLPGLRIFYRGLGRSCGYDPIEHGFIQELRKYTPGGEKNEVQAVRMNRIHQLPPGGKKGIIPPPGLQLVSPSFFQVKPPPVRPVLFGEAQGGQEGEPPVMNVLPGFYPAFAAFA